MPSACAAPASPRSPIARNEHSTPCSLATKKDHAVPDRAPCRRGKRKIAPREVPKRPFSTRTDQPQPLLRKPAELADLYALFLVAPMCPPWSPQNANLHGTEGFCERSILRGIGIPPPRMLIRTAWRVLVNAACRGDSWPKMVRSHPDDTFVWRTDSGPKNTEIRVFSGFFGISAKNVQNGPPTAQVERVLARVGLRTFFRGPCAYWSAAEEGWRRWSLVAVQKDPEPDPKKSFPRLTP